MEKSDSKKEEPATKPGPRSGESTPASGGAGKGGGLKPLHYVAIGLAVLGLLLILLLSNGEDDSGSSETETTASVKTVQVVSESGLLGAMQGVGYPVYWAGPRIGVEYEVSRPEEGRAFVRYLPEGEEAESDRAFLTVGSYEQADALANVRKLGRKPGAILIRTAGGGAAYADGSKATSAYLAFPGVNTQVEVYDPQPGKALGLIRSGAIVPIG